MCVAAAFCSSSSNGSSNAAAALRARRQRAAARQRQRDGPACLPPSLSPASLCFSILLSAAFCICVYNLPAGGQKLSITTTTWLYLGFFLDWDYACIACMYDSLSSTSSCVRSPACWILCLHLLPSPLLSYHSLTLSLLLFYSNTACLPPTPSLLPAIL